MVWVAVAVITFFLAFCVVGHQKTDGPFVVEFFKGVFDVREIDLIGDESIRDSVQVRGGSGHLLRSAHPQRFPENLVVVEAGGVDVYLRGSGSRRHGKNHGPPFEGEVLSPRSFL